MLLGTLLPVAMAIFSVGWGVAPDPSIGTLGLIAVSGSWLGWEVGSHLNRYRHSLSRGQRHGLHFLLVGVTFGALLIPLCGFAAMLASGQPRLSLEQLAPVCICMWAVVVGVTQVGYLFFSGPPLLGLFPGWEAGNSSSLYAEKLPDSP
ncbi:MAG: hypothetical protein D6722_10345 [Bacteroidetes bacterium]|nr:MAG: hypothetical protein D6722_10345 [Bacteroidota bacterium]